MKMEIRPVLIAALGLILASQVTAQTFKVLHSFTATSPDTPFTNSDGTRPLAGLILSDNTLYGTAYQGGTSGAGTVFAVGTEGRGFTNLNNFAAFPDGTYPSAGLILSGNTLYGTTLRGGIYDVGTVFGVSTNGTGFTNLYSFTGGSDGGYPHGCLVLNANTLYGTAYFGGTAGKGTVFAINTDGTGFTNLYSFTGGSDGASPYAALVLSGNTLYGTTFGDFGTANGTEFAINTDGTGFTNLHAFTATSGSSATNSDGAKPMAGLILSGNTLYGTAINGGGSGNGTVFGVNTNGTGFRNMHSFTAASGSQLLSYTNSDGAGAYGGLVLSGNTLYGTAQFGGSSGNGTVFSIFIQPELTITPSEANVILTWPTNYDGFILQSATNLVSAVWTTNSPAPVVVNGQNTVTNPITGTQQFYRLSQ